MKYTVRAVHTAVGLTRLVALAILGAGAVGRILLKMLERTRGTLAVQDLDLRLVASANSRRWVHDVDGIALNQALVRFGEEAVRPADEGLIEQLKAGRFTDVIVIDVSASPLQPLHDKAMRAEFHVVTANKVPSSRDLDSHRALLHTRDETNVNCGYETTFGAGLPVLHTLKELVAIGDTL